jgi:hypothetical protein
MENETGVVGIEMGLKDGEVNKGEEYFLVGTFR